MKVLFLTPWYPSERDAMAGLFVQKHADAVRAQGVDVRVIHSQTWGDTWRQWRALQREEWMPDLVQLNVIQKQGLLALWLKKRYHIPYIIVEHWSGYLPENGAFLRQSSLKQHFAKYLCCHAEAVFTVSRILEQAMRNLGFQAKQWKRVRNVVDDFFFDEPQSLKVSKSQNDNRKCLLHVSCFDEQAKNVCGLLQAFRMVCSHRNDVQLVLVGTGKDWLQAKKLAEQLNYPTGTIRFTGELTPPEVCEWFRRADAFVLSSRYETAGIVLIEAAATGTPILSTPVGLAEEIVTPGTGVLVPCDIALNNPRLYADYIETILDYTRDRYLSNTLRSAAKQYSFSAVGKQLKGIYEQVCTRKI